MTTNYDPIAEQYKRSKQQPWRTHIELFTLMELIGDLKGLTVLDVACGEGFYTRLMRQHGALQVTGVDRSKGMIALARKQELEHPQGIDYVVADARNLPLMAEFDLVVAAYLLNYAQSRRELEEMCAGIARSLKPGGRFVTVNCNPFLDFRVAPSYRKYNFEAKARNGYQEGSPITWTIFLDNGSFEIENYYLDAAIHENAFRTAGFREIHWHQPRLAPQADNDDPFWAEFLQQPPVILIECVKEG